MSDNRVDISDLSKAEVLAALFNASAPGGMGFLQAAYGPDVMTVEYAQQLVDEGNTATPDYGGVNLPGRAELYFDYLYGRPLKLDLTNDSFDPWGFDRDNGGPGTAQQLIDQLRTTKDVNPPKSQEAHETASHLNAHIAMEMANTPSTITEDGVVVNANLGGAESGDHLERSVDTWLDRLRRRLA